MFKIVPRTMEPDQLPDVRFAYWDIVEWTSS